MKLEVIECDKNNDSRPLINVYVLFFFYLNKILYFVLTL